MSFFGSPEDRNRALDAIRQVRERNEGEGWDNRPSASAQLAAAAVQGTLDNRVDRAAAQAQRDILARLRVSVGPDAAGEWYS
jgi:hypothetical protein